MPASRPTARVTAPPPGGPRPATSHLSGPQAPQVGLEGRRAAGPSPLPGR